MKTIRLPLAAAAPSCSKAPCRRTFFATSRQSVFLRWLALVCILLGSVNANVALAAKSYVINSDSTVTDPSTGLTWMRCAMGQTWSGTTCTGGIRQYTFVEANALTGTTTFAGQSDWRLPNIRELQTIVDRAVHSPAIDGDAFPTTSLDWTWSSSPSAKDSDKVWPVRFLIGYSDYSSTDRKYTSSAVRLVRGGQSLNSLMSIARPIGDYVDSGNGTITHTPTNLMWKRCAEGQVWTGTTCNGTASKMTAVQTSAISRVFAGQSDWRVPTEDELLSLVDYTRHDPAINTTAFPATPADYFWSGSPYVYKLGFSWVVHFYHGGATGIKSDGSVSPAKVRLVRGGQSLRVLTLSVEGGAGTITRSPDNVSCSSICAPSFADGTSVTLTATAGPTSTFSGWSGACSGSASCVVNMIAAQNVSATFTPRVDTSAADCVFDWAARTFPQFFAPAKTRSENLAPYYYRYYSGTGNYLATNLEDGHLLALGVATGGSLLDLGLLSNQLQVSGCGSRK